MGQDLSLNRLQGILKPRFFEIEKNLSEVEGIMEIKDIFIIIIG